MSYRHAIIYFMHSQETTTHKLVSCLILEDILSANIHPSLPSALIDLYLQLWLTLTFSLVDFTFSFG